MSRNYCSSPKRLSSYVLGQKVKVHMSLKSVLQLSRQNLQTLNHILFDYGTFEVRSVATEVIVLLTTSVSYLYEILLFIMFFSPFLQGKFVDAIRCYTSCIEIDPSQAVPFTNRALCHLKLQQVNYNGSRKLKRNKVSAFYVLTCISWSYSFKHTVLFSLVFFFLCMWCVSVCSCNLRSCHLRLFS